MEEHVYKKIEAYISGTMSAEDAQQFELAMTTQPELKEEVALYRSINHHLTETEYEDGVSDSNYKKELDTYLKGEEAAAIKEKLVRIKEDYKTVPQNEKPKTRSLYYIISAAAAVILLFGLLFTGNSNASLYTTYYQSSDLPSFTSRADNESLLSKASTSFKSGDLDTSLASFQEYIQGAKNEIDPLIYVYTGLIYSEKENLEEAITQFDLLEKSKSLDSSRALWYKALTYVKFDKPAEAKEILTMLLKNPSNYKYTEAKELLEKL
ncbi:hypothetical protein [uncultured Dokdonia sp.]|uniref:tetratricopeptide repeat protein n=1 Tax=uncultured Dokdonia sp. TaxID=575653 RepID=UPI00260C7DA1|nr:hypothetical protein [uncultured Dokdonia sp.]